MRAAACILVLVACGSRGAPPAPAVGSATAPATSTEPVVLTLATAPGLSGLAVDESGALWTVAERAGAAFRIVLADDRVASLDRVPVEGIPAGVDLEAIAMLGNGRVALGTEGHDDATATVWLASLADDGARIVADPAPLVTAADLDHPVIDNHGVEGLCGRDAWVAFGLETVLEEDGARWASVYVTSTAGGAPSHTRIRLTSETGKLSSLECTIAAGSEVVDLIAIERHFEVTRVITFALFRDQPAEVVLDLSTLAEGRNFEGLTRLPDGRLALVTDNQWKTIDGPSELVIVPDPATSAP